MQPVSQAPKISTRQQHLLSLRDSARHRLTDTPSQASVLQSQETARQRREDAALHHVLQAAPAILQDMAANVAEAVAVCYLAEARSGLNGELFCTELSPLTHGQGLRQIQGVFVPW